MKGLLIMLLCWVVAGDAMSQRPIRFTPELSVVDLTNSLAQPGGVPVPLKPTDLNVEMVDWTTASKPEPFIGEFELRFKSAISVGSIFVYGADSVQYGGAGSWKEFEPGPEKGRLLQVLPIPAGDLVDGLRARIAAQPYVEGEKTLYRATLPFLTLVPLRMVNVAGEATVTTSSVDSASPAAQVLVDGVVEKEANFSTAPRESETSEKAPEWIVLSWKEPQSIRGINLLRGSQEAGLGRSVTEIYKGEGDPVAAAGESTGWEQLQGRATTPGLFRSHQLFVSPNSVETRAVRIRSIGGVQQLKLGELVILNDLGYAPGPISSRSVEESKQIPQPETAPAKTDK